MSSPSQCFARVKFGRLEYERSTDCVGGIQCFARVKFGRLEYERSTDCVGGIQCFVRGKFCRLSMNDPPTASVGFSVLRESNSVGWVWTIHRLRRWFEIHEITQALYPSRISSTSFHTSRGSPSIHRKRFVHCWNSVDPIQTWMSSLSGTVLLWFSVGPTTTSYIVQSMYARLLSCASRRRS